MDKTKAIDAAVSQIERQFGKGSIMRMGDEERPRVASIPTGALALDLGVRAAGVQAQEDACGQHLELAGRRVDEAGEEEGAEKGAGDAEASEDPPPAGHGVPLSRVPGRQDWGACYLILPRRPWVGKVGGHGNGL